LERRGKGRLLPHLPIEEITLLKGKEPREKSHYRTGREGQPRKEFSEFIYAGEEKRRASRGGETIFLSLTIRGKKKINCPGA